MLTLRKADSNAGIGIDIANIPVEQLLEKEWLLTNSRGGFASSTVIGCNTRRYHGLLVGSLEPPTSRIMALSGCLETVLLGMCEFKLSTVEFPRKISPDGFLRLRRFCRGDIGVHFDYQLGDLQLTKSVYLHREQDTVAVVYKFAGVHRPIEFVVRPMVALRDFHSLQKSGTPLVFSSIRDEAIVRNAHGDCGQVLLKCPHSVFETDSQWWFNFTYRRDKERGQEYTEDLFSPGAFRCSIDSPTTIVLWANLGREYKLGQFVLPDIEDVVRGLREHHSVVVAPADDDKVLAELYLAGDQFIARRPASPKGLRRGEQTILAGFPWFADWGRDTFISLPGLLLATRRYDEAKSILITFAQAASEGMIPNCFDDYSNAAHFNSVDASLWFVNAAFEYLRASGDRPTFEEQLLPTIVSIVDSYRRGTRFGIHADSDGLITAGDGNTQLTWMDARYEGVAFTPRYGKAVEINALWYNALMMLAGFYDDEGHSRGDIRAEADRVKESFCRVFWNESWGWLNDCVLPDGEVDATLRPNQIFAVSLPFSPLDSVKQKAVVDIVEKKLLTPFGLRTLSQDDRRYHGIYVGPQAERDGAYHQGTVWPYLVGPFVEAYLKVHGFTPESKGRAFQFIEPLLKHLTEDGCIGQVSEIFDGDPPHKPRGCFAQAWSVAELIRAYLLVKD